MKPTSKLCLLLCALIVAFQMGRFSKRPEIVEVQTPRWEHSTNYPRQSEWHASYVKGMEVNWDNLSNFTRYEYYETTNSPTNGHFINHGIERRVKASELTKDNEAGRDSERIEGIKERHKLRCDTARHAIQAAYLANKLGWPLTNYLAELEKAWEELLAKQIAEASK